jgi:adenosylcobinamide-phosphate synthase
VTAAGIALGMGADAAFGDPRRLHPVAGFGQAAAAFERVVYRPTHAAGAVYAGVLVGGAALLGVALERVLPRSLARGVALYVALGGRSLAREAQAVADLVARADLDGARVRIRSLVGRDPEHLDAEELCAAVIESVAENTVDAVVAPLLWAAVAGAPGVLAHRAVNTLDAMVGRRNERYGRFGTAAARADDVANWPAARLAGALTVALAATAADSRAAGAGAAGAAGAPSPTGAAGGSRAAWRAWRDDAAQHPSPNAGVIEAAFAGALGLTLGGTLAYAGQVEHRPRLGAGRAPTPHDIARAIRLARTISLATAVLAMVRR